MIYSLIQDWSHPNMFLNLGGGGQSWNIMSEKLYLSFNFQVH